MDKHHQYANPAGEVMTALPDTGGPLMQVVVAGLVLACLGLMLRIHRS